MTFKSSIYTLAIKRYDSAKLIFCPIHPFFTKLLSLETSNLSDSSTQTMHQVAEKTIEFKMYDCNLMHK